MKLRQPVRGTDLAICIEMLREARARLANHLSYQFSEDQIRPIDKDLGTALTLLMDAENLLVWDRSEDRKAYLKAVMNNLHGKHSQ